MRKTSRKCAKKREREKTVRKSTIFRRFFSTTKNRCFLKKKKKKKKKKTDTVKIPITRALRRCYLFSIPMFGFPGSGIYKYLLKKIKMKTCFRKKLFSMTKNSYFFRKNQTVRKLFKNKLSRSNSFSCIFVGITNGTIKQRDEFDQFLLLLLSTC